MTTGRGLRQKLARGTTIKKGLSKQGGRIMLTVQNIYNPECYHIGTATTKHPNGSNSNAQEIKNKKHAEQREIRCRTVTFGSRFHVGVDGFVGRTVAPSRRSWSRLPLKIPRSVRLGGPFHRWCSKDICTKRHYVGARDDSRDVRVRSR